MATAVSWAREFAGSVLGIREHWFPYPTLHTHSHDGCIWMSLLFSSCRTKETHARLCSSGGRLGFSGSVCHCPHPFPDLTFPLLCPSLPSSTPPHLLLFPHYPAGILTPRSSSLVSSWIWHLVPTGTVLSAGTMCLLLAAQCLKALLQHSAPAVGLEHQHCAW